MDAFILAFFLIVWIAYVILKIFGKRTIERNDAWTTDREGGVHFGGTAKKDQGEVVLTSQDPKKQNQYGFIEFGTLQEQFTLRFEMLLEEPDLGTPTHVFLWLGLGGDPDKESATSSNAQNDGGTRIFIMKTDIFGQRNVLDIFRTIVGIARPSADEPWDLTERVQYLPKNQWVLVTITGDLRARTFQVTIDDARFSFVVPMRFEGPFRGYVEAYIGAKTLRGSGIRIRNLGLAS